MKEKVAITLDDALLSSLDSLVDNGVGKNRSQIIEAFLREHMMERTSIGAIIFAHDVKWDHGTYTHDIPKCLLDIEGKPVLFYQLRSMSQAGVRTVRICIDTGKTDICRARLDGLFPHMDIAYIEMDASYRTGRALRLALEEPMAVDYLLITNGDTYMPGIDIREYLIHHQEHHADWSFVLKYIRTNAEKYGNALIRGNTVIEFVDTPATPNGYQYLTNCGWYITSPQFYQSLAYDGEHIETDLFYRLPNIAKTNAYIYSPPWHHIQSDAEYELANGY